MLIALCATFVCSTAKAQTPDSIIIDHEGFIILDTLQQNQTSDTTLNAASMMTDSLSHRHYHTRLSELQPIAADSLSLDSTEYRRQLRRQQRQYNRMNFKPDPNKSLWYSLLFPGAGQIYNRKYWKLPIVYGGTVGVVYAISYTSTEYSQFQRAYLDLLDNNPNTNTHLSILPEGYPESQLESYIQNRMTKFRRYRDLSIIIGVAFYAITVIDAYVDAQLADFDISPDLSMKIRPKFDVQPNTTQPSINCQMQLNF